MAFRIIIFILAGILLIILLDVIYCVRNMLDLNILKAFV